VSWSTTHQLLGSSGVHDGNLNTLTLLSSGIVIVTFPVCPLTERTHVFDIPLLASMFIQVQALYVVSVAEIVFQS
jgi:hypothetical protein